MSGSRESLSWGEQKPDPEQGGEQERCPNDERRGERQAGQRRNQPGERRRGDEGLHVELRPKATDRALLGRQVVEAPVSLPQSDLRRRKVEPEIIPHGVLSKERRRGDDQLPARQDDPNEEARRRPQAGPLPKVLDQGRPKIRARAGARALLVAIYLVDFAVRRLDDALFLRLPPRRP